MSEPRGPTPRAAVRGALVRATVETALGPLGCARYLLQRRRREHEARADLAAVVAPAPAPRPSGLPDRPLRLFLSCAEPSGEIHAANLVAALRAELARASAPEPELVGLGGDRLAEAGVRLVGRPVDRAAMGLDGVLGSVPWYLRLLESAARALRDAQFDACVPVDSPALHVPLGRIAHRYGVPVAHYVTPQYWAWAPWRVAAYRDAVDLALTILPFEVPWFERNGVRTRHVGHPMLDELGPVEAARDATREDEDPAGPIALLPGSRGKTVARNLPFMLEVLARLRERQPELAVVLPQDRGDHEEEIRAQLDAAGASDWVRLEIGDLHGSLRRARAAFSVSGTILIDLLHHRLPAVAVYRLGGTLQGWAYRNLLTTPWFASVNLLAGEELFPELCFTGTGPVAAACDALERCYKDGTWRRRCRTGLERAAVRIGPPGAATRAARHVLDLARRRP